VKTGYSLLLGEYVAAPALEYRDCEPFQIVCPQCREPLFKVSRQDAESPIEYLSHYKASAAYAADCELRVSAQSATEVKRHNRDARDQRLRYFLEVFERLLSRDPVFSAPENLPTLHKTFNRSKAFKLLKNQMQKAQRDNSGGSDGREMLQRCSNLYLSEIRDFGVFEKTGFAVTTQVRIAADMMSYLTTESASGNFSLLCNQATAFLMTRIDGASVEDVGPEAASVIQMIRECLERVIFRGKRDGLQCIADMAATPINPPFVESPSNLLLKVASEITFESFGVLIRLPYFSALKERQEGSK
jgi:hypothetical protein